MEIQLNVDNTEWPLDFRLSSFQTEPFQKDYGWIPSLGHARFIDSDFLFTRSA